MTSVVGTGSVVPGVAGTGIGKVFNSQENYHPFICFRNKTRDQKTYRTEKLKFEFRIYCRKPPGFVLAKVQFLLNFTKSVGFEYC